MELTAATDDLARAAWDAARLVPGRLVEPMTSGLMLTADAGGVVLEANDRERTVRIDRPAVVHTDGRVLVPARPLAETLRALAAPEVRLRVEGSRLAVRVPGARYALSLLDADRYPGPPDPPPVCGEVDASLLREALATVAAAASRDDALPLYTGVRVRAEIDRLVLVATDRFRMAIATLPWQPAAHFDAPIPAALLVEVAKRLPGSGSVRLHAGKDRVGFFWTDVTVTTSVLDGAFVDESRVKLSDADTWVELDADALADAVRRVAVYADVHGAIALDVADSEVRLRGAGGDSGEAEEFVKATVSGGRTGQVFQTRYLADALRPFTGGPVVLAIQSGLRATTFTRPQPHDLDLRYVVMPMLPPTAGSSISDR
jgi:DNA polymerase III subunit beta